MRTLLLAAAAAAAQPALAQDSSRFDSMAATHGGIATRIVDHWRGRPGTGAPERAPARDFEIPEQYAATITAADRQLMARRMQAITDLLLAQPSLQSPDIVVAMRPFLYRLNMNDGQYLTMGLNFEFRQGGEMATISISTSPMRGMAGEWRTVGQTAGGCRREQKVRGSGSGGEVYRIGTVGPSRGTTIRAVEIEGGGAVGIGTRRDFRSVAESLQGRAIAAVQTLDCARLLTLANSP